MDHWTERLSEYLDDELTLTDRVALERHLEHCGSCRSLLAELREVVCRAETLEDSEPTSELWAGIAARIQQPDLQVIDLAEARSRRSPARISFSLPQLAAASIALMLTTGGLVWALAAREPAGPLAQAPRNGVVQPVSHVAEELASPYADALETLEGALDQRRDQLDTSTVRVLEQNLRTIDQAIAEARQALERDPSSVFLNRHLENTMKKKVELLRIAAGMRRAST